MKLLNCIYFILQQDFFDVEKWYQGLLEYAIYCLWQGCGCTPISVAWGTRLFYCPALKIRKWVRFAPSPRYGLLNLCIVNTMCSRFASLFAIVFCSLEITVTSKIGNGWVVWSKEETTVLLQIWNEDHIKRQLSTTHRNATVFLQFSVELKAKGFMRTAMQCRVKVKKLCQKYLITCDKIKSGESSDKLPIIQSSKGLNSRGTI